MTVLPAALAFVERCGGISGMSLLCVVVSGLDISVRVRLEARGKLRFSHPATAETALVAGLDADGIAHALDIQYA